MLRNAFKAQVFTVLIFREINFNNQVCFEWFDAILVSERERPEIVESANLATAPSNALVCSPTTQVQWIMMTQNGTQMYKKTQTSETRMTKHGVRQDKRLRTHESSWRHWTVTNIRQSCCYQIRRQRIGSEPINKHTHQVVSPSASPAC